MEIVLLMLLAALVPICWYQLLHRREVAQDRQANCRHTFTRTSRVAEWPPGARNGFPTKECESCHQQWHLYAGTTIPWEKFRDEYGAEERDRKVQWLRHRAHYEMICEAKGIEPGD